MERPGAPSISLSDVSKLLDESKSATQVAWLMANAFGHNRASALLFFHRVLCKTAVLYVHHRGFIVAAADQLAAIFGDDDQTVLYLRRARRIIDGEESVSSSEVMVPAASSSTAFCFSMQFIDKTGFTLGPLYIRAAVGLRLVARLLSPDTSTLCGTLTTLAQLPYSVLEALISTQSEHARSFVMNVLVAPEYRTSSHLRGQLEVGNLSCHFYAMELFSVQMKSLPLSVQIPMPADMPVIDEGLARAELCNNLDSSRLLVAAHEYFLYRVSDLLYVSPQLPEWDPQRLANCFFSIVVCMLQGIRLDLAPVLLNGSSDTLGEVKKLVEVHRELFERARQASLEIGRFLLVEHAKANGFPAPPPDFPIGWEEGYDTSTSKTLLRGATDDLMNAGASILQQSRPSQTVLSHLYRQSIRLTAQMVNYTTAVTNKLEESFNWSWTSPELLPVSLVVRELYKSLHFQQANELAQVALNDTTYWQRSPPVVLHFPTGTPPGAVRATMEYMTRRFEFLKMKAITITERYFLEGRKRSPGMVSQDLIDKLGDQEFFDVFADDRSAYLLLSQRLLETLHNLSLTEWLSERRSAAKPTSVAPILLRQYACRPVDPARPGEDRTFALYSFLTVLTTWLPLSTQTRAHKQERCPYLLPVDHELFGCYRWLHCIVSHMVLEDPAMDTVVSSFLCMKKRHYISYDVLSLMYDTYLEYKAQLIIGEGKDLELIRECCEENAYSWIVLTCIKIRHSGQREGTIVEFTLDLESAKFLSFLSDTDNEENIVRLNFLFYRLLRKGWLPRDLIQEALKSFTIVEPQSHISFAPRELYRGLADAKSLSNIPNLGVVPEPRASTTTTTHPYKPYYYELLGDMKEQNLGPLASYLVKLEWSTYRSRSSARDYGRRSACNWEVALDYAKFIKDESFFNGDVPVAVLPVSYNSTKASIGVSFLYFDTGFLVKSAKLCEPSQPPAPPQNEEIEFTQLPPNRKRARKPEEEIKRTEAHLFKNGQQRHRSRFASVMPHNDILALIQTFGYGGLDVDKVGVAMFRTEEGNGNIYSDIIKACNLNEHMTEEDRQRMRAFHKEAALYKNMRQIQARENWDYHVEHSSKLPGSDGLIFDEYGSFDR